MSYLFEKYKAWRESTDTGTPEEDPDYGDKRDFMRFAKLKKLDNDDLEELEMQYDEYLIEKEEEEINV